MPCGGWRLADAGCWDQNSCAVVVHVLFEHVLLAVVAAALAEAVVAVVAGLGQRAGLEASAPLPGRARAVADATVLPGALAAILGVHGLSERRAVARAGVNVGEGG